MKSNIHPGADNGYISRDAKIKSLTEMQYEKFYFQVMQQMTWNFEHQPVNKCVNHL